MQKVWEEWNVDSFFYQRVKVNFESFQAFTFSLDTITKVDKISRFIQLVWFQSFKSKIIDYFMAKMYENRKLVSNFNLKLIYEKASFKVGLQRSISKSFLDLSFFPRKMNSFCCFYIKNAGQTDYPSKTFPIHSVVFLDILRHFRVQKAINNTRSLRSPDSHFRKIFIPRHGGL